MFSLLKLVVALGALAMPAVHATTYAQFCNDHACSVDCGASLSIDNPACLNEPGRGSIKFHGANAQYVNLVFTPGENCNCQEECYPVVSCDDGLCAATEECLSLKNQKPAQSYRFVGANPGDCSPNNCGVPPRFRHLLK